MKCHSFALIAAAVAAPSLAQTDQLIYEDYFGTFFRVQGANIQAQWGRADNSLPFVAIGNEVRSWPVGGGSGTTYDLNGNVQGAFNVGGNNGTHDAGTDGVKYIYNSQNFCGQGQMWRYDLDGSNATYLWDWSPNGNCGLGTTYDTATNTLWLQSYGDNVIWNYDLNGNVISSFPSVGSSYGLAYEQSTDTLWTIDSNQGTGVLAQYDKSGNLMQSVPVPNLGGVPHSLEFVVNGIPAPGAAALLGVGGLVAVRRRRA